MRFHAKLTVVFFLQLLTAGIWISLSIRVHGLVASSYRLLAGIYIFLLLFTLFSWFYTYWEIRPDGLFERILFRTRIVTFDEITRVSPALSKDKPRPGWLNIQFLRSGLAFATGLATFDRGSLLFAPAHADRFLSALRHAAPQASFDTP